MINVSVSSEISSVCSTFVGACVEANVVNTPYNDRLWNAIHEVEQRLRSELTFETVKALPSIAATRAIYTPRAIVPLPSSSSAACSRVRNSTKSTPLSTL